MWFTEDPWPPMFLCGLAALLCIAIWSNSKRAVHLFSAVGCLVLGGVVYAVEQVIVTPAEQVEGLVAALCEDFQQKRPQTLDFFSDSTPQLKLMCQGAMLMVQVKDDLRLTDFQTNVTNDGSRAVVHFRANAGLSVTGYGDVGRQPARFKLTWAKEPAGWKIVEVTRMHPIRDEELSLLEKSAG